MRGYSSRYLKQEDMHADPDYKRRLRDFMQEINPKPEHVLKAFEEMNPIVRSTKRDMVVIAYRPQFERPEAAVQVWASNFVEAMSKAADVMPQDLPDDCRMTVVSPDAYQRVVEFEHGRAVFEHGIKQAVN